MVNILKQLRSLSLKTHRAISSFAILGCSVTGWILVQFSDHMNLALVICLIGLICGIIWHIVFVRCPHCSHHFNPRASIPSFCPECGKELE